MTLCNRCGKGEMREIKVRDYRYKTNLGTVTVEGETVFEECHRCKYRPLSGPLLDLWNRRILRKLVDLHHLFAAKELQFIFSVLPYTQTEIAQAIGRDKGTVSKYKTGDQRIDKAVDALFRDIIEDYLEGNNNTMEALRTMRETSDEPTHVTSIAAGSGRR